MKIYLVFEEGSDDNYPSRVLTTCDLEEVKNTLLRLYNSCSVSDDVEHWCEDTCCGVNWHNSQYRAWTEEVDTDDLLPAGANIAGVNVPQGKIVVSKKSDPFAGVDIDLQLHNGTTVAIATIESDADNNGAITTWAYTNAMSDEYTHRLVLENLEQVTK